MRSKWGHRRPLLAPACCFDVCSPYIGSTSTLYNHLPIHYEELRTANYLVLGTVHVLGCWPLAAAVESSTSNLVSRVLSRSGITHDPTIQEDAIQNV